MISSSNKISRKEEVNELFEQLGQVLEERVEALLIGGAVMLELELKDATKDIDVVCRSEGDKERLLAAAKALGFEIVGPEKRHERLGVKRLAVKGGRNLDVFARRIDIGKDYSK
ncbi:MAG: BRCT domain-containing protein [Methanotrichaceae archaeon]|nr:BRCT domain-containing protein [Methanotrichaceae archaeon]